MTKLARCAEAQAARAVQDVRQDVLALRSRYVAGSCQKCHGVCVEDGSVNHDLVTQVQKPFRPM
ncbi:hypothetical protein CCP1ISM_2920001 [Azospirillaceae bacterium]